MAANNRKRPRAEMEKGISNEELARRLNRLEEVILSTMRPRHHVVEKYGSSFRLSEAGPEDAGLHNNKESIPPVEFSTFEDGSENPFLQSPLLNRANNSLNVSTFEDGSENPFLQSPLLNRANSVELINEPEPKDQKILEVLGENPEEITKFSDPLHKEIKARWEYIVSNGLTKEIRDELVSKYNIPENVRLLSPPKVNQEVGLAVTDSNLKMDNFYLIPIQRSLGAGITALGLALTNLLAENVNVPQEILINLSNSGRLLSDIFHSLSIRRRVSLSSKFNKEVIEICKKTPVTEWLFGDNFEEKVKNSTLAKKTSKELTMKRFDEPSTSKNLKVPPPQKFHQHSRGGGIQSRPRQGNKESLPESKEELPENTKKGILEKVSDRSRTSHGTESYPGCRKVVREALLRKGAPESSLETFLSSISLSTLKQYNCTFKEWWSFCLEKKLDVFGSGRKEVISFLQHIYEQKNLSYSSFNSYRSALSLILENNIGDDPQIKRFMKGLSRLRPQRPRYRTTWDPSVILRYLEKIDSNSMMDLVNLSEKLAILLMLVTGQRLQTLSLIKMENILIETEGVKIFIEDRIKTSGPGRYQPCLEFPFFREKPKVCVASALIEYMERTMDIRKEGEVYLFVLCRPPYTRASPQTISHWIKRCLTKAGIDVSRFSAYSVRHASTSAAFRGGVSLEVIRKTAGWSKNSEVFAKFYNKPLDENKAFAHSILELS